MIVRGEYQYQLHGQIQKFSSGGPDNVLIYFFLFFEVVNVFIEGRTNLPVEAIEQLDRT